MADAISGLGGGGQATPYTVSKWACLSLPIEQPNAGQRTHLIVS